MKRFAILTIALLFLPACNKGAIEPPPTATAPKERDALDEAIRIASQNQPAAAASIPQASPSPVPRMPTIAKPEPSALNGVFVACPGFSGANIRSAPSLKAAIVFTARCGKRVQIGAARITDIGWRWVAIDGVQGWTAGVNVQRF